MAITIVDSPNNFALLNQKLIYLCTSGNVANDGFRFQFEITIAGATITFLVPPNPNNKGIMDIREAIRGYFSPLLAPTTAADISIHGLGVNDAFLHKYEDAASSTWIMTVVVTVKEGWIISGVFTPTAVGQATDTIRVLNAKFDRVDQGNSPLLFPSYPTITTGMSEAFLTDRIGGSEMTNENGFPISNGYGLGGYVAIGVNEVEYGIISFLVDDGTLFPSDDHITKIQILIVDSAGVPHTAEYAITTSGTGRLCHFGAYPANLNATTFGTFLKPSSYPGWKYYIIKMLKAGDVQFGNPLIFYPVDREDCLNGQDVLILTWINSMGGWDQFRFTKLQTTKYEVERKRFRKVLGTYGDATFSYAQYDRGLSEVAIQTDMLVTASTDWLEDGEFIFLSNLIRSQHVFHLASEKFGAYIIPVVIEQNNWEEQQLNFTQLKKIELTLRFSNRLW